MPCVRHLIVCEGESEWAYLQRLQSFLDRQRLPPGRFEPGVRMIAPRKAVAKTGTFGSLKRAHARARAENRNVCIRIWADFDLYHRNDNNCADDYARKSSGIPDFLFSFHNFEDFFALHHDEEQFQEWVRFGQTGHFMTPLHSQYHCPVIERMFPGYAKGAMAAGFISWPRLRNLKRNKSMQPTSNPHDLKGIRGFADFLVAEIESAFPGMMD